MHLALQPKTLFLGYQKKYKEEAEKTMSHYVPVLDTPEMQRVRENQKNFSTVSSRTPSNRALFRPTTVSLAESRAASLFVPVSEFKVLYSILYICYYEWNVFGLASFYLYF